MPTPGVEEKNSAHVLAFFPFPGCADVVLLHYVVVLGIVRFMVRIAKLSHLANGGGHRYAAVREGGIVLLSWPSGQGVLDSRLFASQIAFVTLSGLRFLFLSGWGGGGGGGVHESGAAGAESDHGSRKKTPERGRPVNQKP